MLSPPRVEESLLGRDWVIIGDACVRVCTDVERILTRLDGVDVYKKKMKRKGGKGVSGIGGYVYGSR